jgi:large subunit ribosomal protein L17
MGYRRLGVKSAHRKALLRNASTSLLKHDKIETTISRAKEISSVAEKMITLGKKGDLASRRAALSYLTDEDTVSRVFSELAEKYADRKGGYTRIIKLGYRRGDAAEMVLLELV